MQPRVRENLTRTNNISSVDALRLSLMDNSSFSTSTVTPDVDYAGVQYNSLALTNHGASIRRMVCHCRGSNILSLTPFALPETQPYWDAAALEQLSIQRCQDCGHYYFPPSPVCPRCTSRKVKWEVLSGRATLYSYMITAAPWPLWEMPAPMSVATVALEEGPRLLSTIVDCEQSPTTLKIDMRLVATWRKFGDGPKLLCFAPEAVTGQ